MKNKLKAILEGSVKIFIFLMYFFLVAFISYIAGYGSKFNNSQEIYDKGVRDGKKEQLQQDEYLYKLMREKYNLGIDLKIKGGGK